MACRLMQEHPALKVNIDVEHARVALFERQCDIAFSAIGHSFAPSTVVTRRVYSLERGLFASPRLIAGIGVARITATFRAHAVDRGELVQLLPQWRCAPLRIHALLPGRALVPAKVRAFLDLLEQESQGLL